MLLTIDWNGWAFVWTLAAYALGSLSSAIVVCRMMGFGDPREGGSGNPGATNVKRLYGNRPAALTLVGDMLKGVLAVWGAKGLGFSSEWVMIAGFAAFVGHLYPLFFQFRGGKGVATFLGVLFGLQGWLGLAVAGVWLFVAKVLRVSSASALVAGALAPALVYLITAWQSTQNTPNLFWVVMTAALSVLLFWRHRSNIKRLIKGEGDVIGRS